MGPVGAVGGSSRDLHRRPFSWLAWFVLYVLTFAVAVYAVVAYGFQPLGSFVHPEMRETFLSHKLGIYTHVFASIAALILGPSQLSSRLRTAYPRFHRISGRIYLGVGVLIGGVSGLYMARLAFGGIVAKLGFAVLAVCWLYTGIRAFTAIRRGSVEEHRRWMVRNYGLTLAAVTLRIYLPVASVAGIAFETSYPAVAWLCWVPNLFVGEWLLHRKRATLPSRRRVPR